MFIRIAAATLAVSLSLQVPGYTQDAKWTFDNASGNEASELGNCSLHSGQVSMLYMAGQHPSQELIRIFVGKPEGKGTIEGPLEWRVGSRDYMSQIDDGDMSGYFDAHSVINDILFIYDLMQADKATIRNRQGETATIDLFGLSNPAREFIKCVDEARRNTSNFQAAAERQQQQSASQNLTCTWNEGIYTAKDLSDPTSEYAVQFKSGVASGELQFTKRSGDKIIWTNVSEFGCSNGASICSVTFKLTDGESQDVVFEEIETTSGDRGLVFAAARQQIYMARSGLETNDGLSEEQDIALPFNFYQLTGCLRR